MDAWIYVHVLQPGWDGGRALACTPQISFACAPPFPSLEQQSSSSRRPQVCTCTVDFSLGICRHQIEPTSTCCLVLNVSFCNNGNPSNMTTPCRSSIMQDNTKDDEVAVPVCAQERDMDVFLSHPTPHPTANDDESAMPVSSRKDDEGAQVNFFCTVFGSE